jgi:hypothetical protein
LYSDESSSDGTSSVIPLPDRNWKIVELNGTGHRFWYVSILIRYLSELGLRDSAQLVTRAGARATGAWQIHLDKIALSGLDVVITEDTRLEIIRSTLKQHAYLVIPDADQWAWDLVWAGLSARSKIHGCALLMRPTPGASLASRARHLLKSVLWRMARVVHPNLNVFHLVAASNGQGPESVVEDPVSYYPQITTRESWLLRNGVDPIKRWLVVLGELSERKSLLEIISALKMNHMQGGNWGLLAIGRASPEMESLLESSMSSEDCSVHYRDCYLTDEDFDTWISVADAVAVLHKNEGSSGVLLKCWAAGAPTLVGGAKTVVEAAELLNMRAIKIASLTASLIFLALSKIEEHNKDSSDVNQSTWEQRQNMFAHSLLGVSL